MTLAELCFIIATVMFAVEALPLVGIVSPVKLQPAGLALVAFALALGAGLAGDLGVEGNIF
ncbi:MAG TPA: hypothetical protein VI876_01485 [Dehalococcoidia bacterium]|jgi:hypothetical protein|nr:hypothetical protein [Dehalococcoidia bacterium]